MQKDDRFDKYHLQALLGRGGMGEVWQAADPRFPERVVAIKVVQAGASRALMEALVLEARTLLTITHHPNMVILYDVVEEATTGQVGLVMECIRGAALSTLIKDHPQGLPWDLAHLVLKGLLDGVGHAHRHKVIHRDLKPDNVRVKQQPGAALEATDIKILDFGLARIEKQFATQYTRGAAGTLTYMSPEQIKEERQGPYTDVYALGAIAYELLTGRPPFGGPGQESFGALIQAHCERPPRPPSMLREGLAGPLEEAILKALAKEGSERFPDAEAMARVLLPQLEGLARQPRQAGPDRGALTADLKPAPPPTVMDPKVFHQGRPAAGSGQALAPIPPGLTPKASFPVPVASRPLRRWEGTGGCLGGFTLIALLGLGFYGWKQLPQARPAGPALAPEVIPAVAQVKGGSYRAFGGATRKVDTFSMGKTHVTVEQFRAFIRATGFDAGKDWNLKGKEACPVTSVSYLDAQAYVRWLSERTGATWYLPSEAEYEFAAGNRGASLTYPWGTNPKPQGQFPASMERSATGRPLQSAVPVGQFPANDLGLADMIGNAWIWTSTPKPGGAQILKGGSWKEAQGTIHISNSASKMPEYRSDLIGFRVATR